MLTRPYEYETKLLYLLDEAKDPNIVWCNSRLDDEYRGSIGQRLFWIFTTSMPICVSCLFTFIVAVCVCVWWLYGMNRNAEYLQTSVVKYCCCCCCKIKHFMSCKKFGILRVPISIQDRLNVIVIYQQSYLSPKIAQCVMAYVMHLACVCLTFYIHYEELRNGSLTDQV